MLRMDREAPRLSLLLFIVDRYSLSPTLPMSFADDVRSNVGFPRLPALAR